MMSTITQIKRPLLRKPMLCDVLQSGDSLYMRNFRGSGDCEVYLSDEVSPLSISTVASCFRLNHSFSSEGFMEKFCTNRTKSGIPCRAYITPIVYNDDTGGWESVSRLDGALFTGNFVWSGSDQYPLCNPVPMFDLRK